MDLPPPACLGCKHFRRAATSGPLACEAFPGGIPDPIIEGRVSHLSPYRGDRGLRFEADPAHPALDVDALLAAAQ